MSEVGHAQAINAHYSRGGLVGAVVNALKAAGKDSGVIAPEVLAPLDQFHIGGRNATLELMRLAGLQRGMAILDTGGGLGGPARTLASELGCRVTVLDLTDEYCRAGELLTARTGLSDRVVFQHGDATDMPFPDGRFDAVRTQHSSMNVAHKKRLYAEIHRVLRPGGRLALHEIMAGPVQPIRYPVPWARDASISFLRPPEAVRSLLAETGFKELVWKDVTAASLSSWRARFLAAGKQQAPPPLGLHLIFGADTGRIGKNMLGNLEENRIVVVQAVFERS